MTRQRHTRIFALLLVALSALLGSADLSQGQGRSDRVEEELQRTDRLLERATELVRESDSMRAQEYLREARRTQDEAWGRFRGGRWEVAGRLTLVAQRAAARAVALARGEDRLRQRALHEGERARNALRDTRDRIDLHAAPMVRGLLDRAHEQLTRGHLQFEEQHYEAAIRLAISAQRLIRQGRAAAQGGAQGPRAERSVERTERLLERARSLIQGGETARAGESLRQAEQLQEEAGRAVRASDPRRAELLTREARGAVNRALAAVRGPIDADRVRDALDEVRALMDGIGERLQGTDQDLAIRLLENARGQWSRAEKLAEEDHQREAMAKIRVARRLAQRAAEALRDGGPR